MNKINLVEEISIHCSKKKVVNFLLEVKNLPKWTVFFKSIVSETPSFIRFNTLLGETETNIKHKLLDDINEIYICSKFLTSNKKEKASLIVSSDKENLTSLQFIISPPESVTEELVESLKNNMRQELNQLKIWLEKKNHE